jgi:hypothetical protein
MVKHFLFFIGYPRSGHSLIASLIDAHPNILISMEWGALTHLKLGYRKAQIYYSISRLSKIFTEKLHNRWTGYSYRVEGQYQGKYEDLLVIGDKLAGQSSLMLRQDPGLLDQLSREVAGLKIIHVIRNPFDIISTMRKRSMEKVGNPHAGKGLDFFSDRFFERVEVVQKLKESGNFNLHDVYHEAFISDPRKGLKNIMEFLEIDYTNEYIESCANIVFENPHKSRLEANWDPELKEKVQKKIDACDFLSKYTFES